jgi:hypothetical protein
MWGREVGGRDSLVRTSDLLSGKDCKTSVKYLLNKKFNKKCICLFFIYVLVLIQVTGGKSIAVLLESILGVSAINPLVAFYDFHGGKRGAILLFCPGHHTRPQKDWPIAPEPLNL